MRMRRSAGLAKFRWRGIQLPIVSGGCRLGFRFRFGFGFGFAIAIGTAIGIGIVVVVVIGRISRRSNSTLECSPFHFLSNHRKCRRRTNQFSITMQPTIPPPTSAPPMNADSLDVLEIPKSCLRPTEMTPSMAPHRIITVMKRPLCTLLMMFDFLLL
jgi:hypothetical protein